MRIVFFIFFLYNVCFGLTIFDSLLYTITDEFTEQIEKNPNFKIYSCLITNIFKNIKLEKNKLSLIVYKILLLSILFEAFYMQKRDISEEYIKKEFSESIKKICENKIINDNYFLLLIISEANNRFGNIKEYAPYCQMIAPHWFSKESYFEEKVEYVGPNLKKPINELNFKLINENLFGPAYFIFIYALTRIVSDYVK